MLQGGPCLGGSRARPEQFLSIGSTDYPVQKLSILFVQRSLAAQSSCCFQKEQVPMDQQSCRSSQLCWNQPCNFAVLSLQRQFNMRSMMVQLPMRSATGET